MGPLGISIGADEVQVRELEGESLELALRTGGRGSWTTPDSERHLGMRLTILSWMLELGSAILGGLPDGDATYWIVLQ